MKYNKIAFIFPGQGSQYVGMGKDFAQAYPLAKQTFEEADDLLQRNLSSTIFNGPQESLTETRNSQASIYVTSMSILRVLEKLFPSLLPSACAGHSLGEYSALTASKKASFAEVLPIVQLRSNYMNDACIATPGMMAAILGLEGDIVERIVMDLKLPHDLWAANFNCPGQVVISGTHKGIEAGIEALKAKGAKRALPLQVHGGFHSGLMADAESKLAPHIHSMSLQNSGIDLVMNTPGGYVHDIEAIRRNLIKQVTQPVRWEQSIRSLASQGVDLFIEIGCGKVLTGLNKRIGVESISIEHIIDIGNFEKHMAASLS